MTTSNAHVRRSRPAGGLRLPFPACDSRSAAIRARQADRACSGHLCRCRRSFGVSEPAKNCPGQRARAVHHNKAAGRAIGRGMGEVVRPRAERSRMATERLCAVHSKCRCDGQRGGQPSRDGGGTEAVTSGGWRVPRHGTRCARCTVTRYWRVPPRGTDQLNDQTRERHARARARARGRARISGYRPGTDRARHFIRPVHKRPRTTCNRRLGWAWCDGGRVVASHGSSSAGKAQGQRAAGLPRSNRSRADRAAIGGKP